MEILIIPPEILVVPALFINLAAIFTVPPSISRVPPEVVCKELPFLVPKLATPELMRIKPLLVKEKLPLFNVPPLIQRPPEEGMVGPNLENWNIPFVILNNPLTMEIFPLLERPFPLASRTDVILFPLLIIIVSKAVGALPLMVLLVFPLKVTYPPLPVKTPLLFQLPLTSKLKAPLKTRLPLIVRSLQAARLSSMVIVTPGSMVTSSKAPGTLLFAHEAGLVQDPPGALAINLLWYPGAECRLVISEETRNPCEYPFTCKDKARTNRINLRAIACTPPLRQLLVSLYVFSCPCIMGLINFDGFIKRSIAVIN